MKLKFPLRFKVNKNYDYSFLSFSNSRSGIYLDFARHNSNFFLFFYKRKKGKRSDLCRALSLYTFLILTTTTKKHSLDAYEKTFLSFSRVSFPRCLRNVSRSVLHYLWTLFHFSLLYFAFPRQM